MNQSQRRAVALKRLFAFCLTAAALDVPATLPLRAEPQPASAKRGFLPALGKMLPPGEASIEEKHTFGGFVRILEQKGRVLSRRTSWSIDYTLEIENRLNLPVVDLQFEILATLVAANGRADGDPSPKVEPFESTFGEVWRREIKLTQGLPPGRTTLQLSEPFPTGMHVGIGAVELIRYRIVKPSCSVLASLFREGSDVDRVAGLAALGLDPDDSRNNSLRDGVKADSALVRCLDQIVVQATSRHDGDLTAFELASVRALGTMGGTEHIETIRSALGHSVLPQVAQSSTDTEIDWLLGRRVHSGPRPPDLGAAVTGVALRDALGTRAIPLLLTVAYGEGQRRAGAAKKALAFGWPSVTERAQALSAAELEKLSLHKLFVDADGVRLIVALARVNRDGGQARRWLSSASASVVVPGLLKALDDDPDGSTDFVVQALGDHQKASETALAASLEKLGASGPVPDGIGPRVKALAEAREANRRHKLRSALDSFEVALARSTGLQRDGPGANSIGEDSELPRDYLDRAEELARTGEERVLIAECLARLTLSDEETGAAGIYLLTIRDNQISAIEKLLGPTPASETADKALTSLAELLSKKWDGIGWVDRLAKVVKGKAARAEFARIYLSAASREPSRRAALAQQALVLDPDNAEAKAIVGSARNSPRGRVGYFLTAGVILIATGFFALRVRLTRRTRQRPLMKPAQRRL